MQKRLWEQSRASFFCVNTTLLIIYRLYKWYKKRKLKQKATEEAEKIETVDERMQLVS